VLTAIAIIVIAAAIGGDGPAWDERRARRKLERDYRATALTRYLPSSACRGIPPE
jgi:hypothetical protein